MEAIHFTRGKDRTNPTIRLRGGIKIRPIPLKDTKGPGRRRPPPALRWLGMHFDRKLRFRQYIEIRAAKAMKVSNHIKALSATTRGPPAAGLRKIVKTVVLPTLLYGYEAWYRGRTRPIPGRQASTRLGAHISLAQRALLKAIRGVLPVWKTFLKDALFGASGLPTAQIALDEARYNYAYRLRTVHKGHPLVSRIEPKIIQRGRKAGQAQRPYTNLQLIASLLPDI